jgi:peptidoglycan-associated lipoprotein
MQRKILGHSTLILIVFGLLMTASCAKKTIKTDTLTTGPKQQETKDQGVRQPSLKEHDVQREKRQSEAIKQREFEEARLRERRRQEMELEEKKRQAKIEKQAAAARERFLNELILFDFDSAVLTQVAQERLKRKAKWLREYPNVKIIIEGHCDERGNDEYNLALGEARAKAAKTFLIDMGISASRLTTISYGEERPFAKGHNEEAWRLNRRAHFVIE